VYFVFEQDMASLSISKISHLIKKGRMNDAEAATADYRLLSSHEVSATGGSRTKVAGMVLHVSKAANVAVAKKLGDKKVKRQVLNHRLVFCRYVLYI
jgi:hypothetical protein